MIGEITDEVFFNRVDFPELYKQIPKTYLPSVSAQLQQTINNPTPVDNDLFGHSVSLFGDTLVVSALLDGVSGTDAGSVYVYVRSGTTWTLQQEINNPSPVDYDYFGYSVALHGDTLVVGAHGDNNSTGAIDVGSVYVYVRSGTTWTLQQTINNPTPVASDRFGYSVSLYGNSLVVGAYGDDAGVTGGSVYVYVRSGTTWALQQEINNPTPVASDQFGYSVALYGDSLVVSSVRDDTSATDVGSVYVYVRSGTTWALQQTINNPTPVDYDYFGGSVSLYGDTLVVGAYADDTNATDVGSVYVYVRSGTTWALQQTINNPTPVASDWFGDRVSLYGDSLVVTAHGDDTGASETGSVYVYTRSGVIWALQQTINNPTPVTSDHFGTCVSLYGNSLVVGAYGDDANATDAGSVYVYDIPFYDYVLTTSHQEINNPTPVDYDYFGGSVSLYGDTLVVGAYADDTGASNAGSVYVYVRSGSTWALQQTINNPTPVVSDQFGISVSLYRDSLVVGAYADDTNATDAGSAYVYVRSGSTWALQQEINNPSPVTSDQFGISVSLYGDTLVVGAYADDTGATDTGSVYVYTRSGSTWALQQTINNPTPVAGDYFGISVSLYGDSLVVGAYGDDTGAVNAGSAHVYVRSGTTWTLQQEINNPTPVASDLFGYSVSLYGDTLVVSAVLDDTGASNAGSVYVYVRSGSTWALQQTINNPTPVVSDQFGISVSLYRDSLVVGAYADDTNATDAGSAYVYVRSGSTWALQKTINNPTPFAVDFFGYSVALYGDSLVVGAHGDDTGASNAGSVYVYDIPFYDYVLATSQQELPNPTPDTSVLSGFSVSLYDDTLAVGSYSDDTGATDAGSVHVYTRSVGDWFLYQRINNPTPASGDHFGNSVSLYGNTLAVGSYSDDTGASDAGSVYVYALSGSTWALQQTINNPTPVAGDYFGISVSLYGDSLVVGAYGDDTGAVNAGSAHVYVRSGTTWALQQTINNPTPVTSDHFGYSVSIYGVGDQSSLVVGAYGDDTGAVNAGSAHVYVRSGTTWALQQTINNPTPTAGDWFGNSVSLYGDSLVVGAYQDDTGATDAGSVYVYVRTGSTWTLQKTINNPTPVTGDNFGNSVSLYSDTLVVGSYLGDTGAKNAGSAYVYVRSGSTWTLQKTIDNPTPVDNDWFGYSVSLYGDSLVVGAYYDDTNDLDAGNVYDYSRLDSNWTLQQDINPLTQVYIAPPPLPPPSVTPIINRPSCVENFLPKHLRDNGLYKKVCELMSYYDNAWTDEEIKQYYRITTDFFRTFDNWGGAYPDWYSIINWFESSAFNWGDSSSTTSPTSTSASSAIDDPNVDFYQKYQMETKDIWLALSSLNDREIDSDGYKFYNWFLEPYIGTSLIQKKLIEKLDIDGVVKDWYDEYGIINSYSFVMPNFPGWEETKMLIVGSKLLKNAESLLLSIKDENCPNRFLLSHSFLDADFLSDITTLNFEGVHICFQRFKKENINLFGFFDSEFHKGYTRIHYEIIFYNKVSKLSDNLLLDDFADTPLLYVHTSLHKGKMVQLLPAWFPWENKWSYKVTWEDHYNWISVMVTNLIRLFIGKERHPLYWGSNDVWGRWIGWEGDPIDWYYSKPGVNRRDYYEVDNYINGYEPSYTPITSLFTPIIFSKKERIVV